MESEFVTNRVTAAEDFRRARRQAELRDVLTRLTGRSSELLSYEDVRRQLKGWESPRQQLEYIPLDAIVGSAGRYQDFTREFMPRGGIQPDRWIGVKMAMSGLSGVPPIEVYRINEVYFVRDGNHRVSVARNMGLTHIQAYVTEVRTRVPIDRNTQPDDLILAAEYADFLDRTHLDELRPDADLGLTAPGNYHVLCEHIQVHRYFMGLDLQRDIDHAEAVTHWYDTVYRPVVELVREVGLLRYFPDRTEADLYIWIARHRGELEEAMGWELSLDAVVESLAARFDPDEYQTSHLKERLLHTLTLDGARLPPLDPRNSEPPARRQRVIEDVLVTVSGRERTWNTLEVALTVARREGARLYGLHVVDQPLDRKDPAVDALREAFEARCRQAGVNGRLAVESGALVRTICKRARWSDVVVVGYTCAGDSLLAKLSSGIRNLIRYSPRPVLAVPGAGSELNRVLLAYDGGSKAAECLYAATYLAGWWGAELTVVTVAAQSGEAERLQTSAREYLDRHAVHPRYITRQGRPSEVILGACREHGCNLIVSGGFNMGTAMELMLGSTVDRVLREGLCPVLICN